MGERYSRKPQTEISPDSHCWNNAVIKNPSANAGDMGLIPELGRSPGGGRGNPLHCSCLENPMDKEAKQTRQFIGSPRVRHDWSDLYLRGSDRQVRILGTYSLIWASWVAHSCEGQGWTQPDFSICQVVRRCTWRQNVIHLGHRRRGEPSSWVWEMSALLSDLIKLNLGDQRFLSLMLLKVRCSDLGIILEGKRED